MITVDIQAASAQMPSLLARALDGERIVFCRGDIPVLEMKPVTEMKPVAGPADKRPLGLAPFPMTLTDDMFDPLPLEMFKVFREDEPPADDSSRL